LRRRTLIVLAVLGGLTLGSVFAVGAVSRKAAPAVVSAGYGVGPVSGTATGGVFVDGKPFKGGTIPYGATILIQPGGMLTLKADVGTLLLYPPPSESIQFVLVRSSDFFTQALRATPAGSNAAPKREPVVEIDLKGGNFSSCAKAGYRVTNAKKPPPGRRLFARGKGHFRTKGHYSSATVRGTFWLTNDRCDGTLIAVKQGSLQVFDFGRNKKVLVKAGKSYLAKATVKPTCSVSTSVGHHVEVSCSIGRQYAGKSYEIVVGGKVVARGRVGGNSAFVARFTATLKSGTPIAVRVAGKTVLTIRS
jgi:hypothetical protein